MPNVAANGIRIEYDTFGDNKNPVLLLIMALGAQMIQWNEKFCQMLADKGLYVIRFDNRDVGLSTKFEEGGMPDTVALVKAMAQGQEVEAPYTLDDMADDAVGLLDALGVKEAHFCGGSMGAAIVQVIGYRHPSRVLSLIPISGTTGNPDLPQAKPEAMQALGTPVPVEREANIEHRVKLQQIMRGRRFKFDEKRAREFAAQSYDRSFYPEGRARQLAALTANGNRKPRLASINAPTLVIHGADDPLVPVEASKDIADGIPGTRLMMIEGMGHEQAVELWPQIVDAIFEHIKKTA